MARKCDDKEFFLFNDELIVNRTTLRLLRRMIDEMRLRAQANVLRSSTRRRQKKANRV